MANWLAQKTVLTRTAFDSKCYKWADPAAPGYDPVKAAHSWEILNDRFDKHNDRRTLQEGKPYEFALHHFGVTEQWTRILLAGHPASSSDEGRLYPAIIYSGPMDSALGFLLDKPITADGKFHQSFSKTRFYTEDKYKELLNAYITIHRRMLPAWHIYVQRMHEDIEYGRKDDPFYLLQYGKIEEHLKQFKDALEAFAGGCEVESVYDQCVSFEKAVMHAGIAVIRDSEFERLKGDFHSATRHKELHDRLMTALRIISHHAHNMQTAAEWKVKLSRGEVINPLNASG